MEAGEQCAELQYIAFEVCEYPTKLKTVHTSVITTLTVCEYESPRAIQPIGEDEVVKAEKQKSRSRDVCFFHPMGHVKRYVFFIEPQRLKFVRGTWGIVLLRND